MVAVATPPGLGGVGIVRLSGVGVLDLAAALFSRPLRPRELRYGNILNAAGETIDQGMAVCFPAPASFTGEDIVEFHGHGGPMVLRLVVDACRALGARLARPGEFSERAFVNGKLDLAQAEAVADLIASGSEAAARSALRSLRGDFSAAVESLAASILWLRTYVEASLDFPDEEDVDHLAAPEIARRLAAARETLAELLQAARAARVVTEGLELALLGRPNAGKSSLLNRLGQEERAIVSDIPGTTRDLLEVDLTLNDVPVRLIDTAGLRQSNDRIEQEGVRRAIERAKRVDLCLLVIDATDPALPEVSGLPQSVPRLTVLNKIDCLDAAATRTLCRSLADQHDALRSTSADPGPLPLSAKTGEGVEQLVTTLLEQVGFGGDAPGFSARQRHLEALEHCAGALALAADFLAQDSSARAPELFAEELRSAHEALGSIVGRVSADDLLGEIFSSFCIGK
ncbi:MAG: tRNA uridine-5-carboxymethylaminomethyl(34) synthesis GTPase MnmE [Pseudomonadota bacterium]